MMNVNDDSRVVNKLETSLTDNARVIIYDHHMFIVQATGWLLWQLDFLVNDFLQVDHFSKHHYCLPLPLPTGLIGQGRESFFEEE